MSSNLVIYIAIGILIVVGLSFFASGDTSWIDWIDWNAVSSNGN